MARALDKVSYRLLAAALALALSGAPRFAEAFAPHPAHRCQCPKGAHDCDCPLCHKAAPAADAADDASLPPCHRALAAQARQEKHESDERARSKPCVTSTCGTGVKALTAAAADPFAPPEAPALAVLVSVGALPPERGEGPSAPREPETPPPRAA